MKYVNTKLCAVVCMLVACSVVHGERAIRARRSDDAVMLSRKDAKVMERALEYVLNRAPRPDAPQLGDSEFPVSNFDFDDIRRVLCLIREQLDDVCDKVESLTDIVQDCCSIIEDIDDCIGKKCYTYDYPLMDGQYANECSDYTVIQWLKAIYRMVAESRGPE